MLVLDLQVVSDRVDDQVALDQPGDERRVAVRIAQVHPGAGAEDRDAPDHPVPGRALGRDADRLLVVAVTANDEVFERDVVRPAGVALGLHRVDRQIAAFEHEVTDHHVARSTMLTVLRPSRATKPHAPRPPTRARDRSLGHPTDRVPSGPCGTRRGKVRAYRKDAAVRTVCT